MTDRKCGTCKHYQGPGKICGDGRPGRKHLLQYDYGSGCARWEGGPAHRHCGNCYMYRGAGVKCRHKDGIYAPIDGDIKACEDWARECLDPGVKKVFTINAKPLAEVMKATWAGVEFPVPTMTFITQPQPKKEKLSMKTKKLIEKIENAFGGKVVVEAYDTLDKYAELQTLDGQEIVRSVAAIGNGDAVKELLKDLKHRARRILKVKK